MRHRDGTLFRPTSFAREMWIGRRVRLEALHVKREPGEDEGTAPPADGFVLCVQGERAWLWIYGEPRGRIERVDSSRCDLRLFSGEKPSESYDRRGYVRVNLPAGHPFANSGGWQYAHRLAMAALMGRMPYKEESIGHRDRKPTSNDPENLLKLDPVKLGEHMCKAQRRVPPGEPEGGQWTFGLREEAPGATQGSLFG